MEKYRAELEDELNNEYSSLTMKEYAQEFHARRVTMGTLSPLTLERDEDEIKRIVECFGDLRVQDIDTATINKTYAKLRSMGLSASALHKTHQKLSQILKQAVKEDILVKNPCDAIDDVKRPAPKERKSLSETQAIQLADDLLNSERNGKIVVVWIALATGARRGELLALTWNDVNFSNKRIYISKQRDKTGTIRDPKSKKSKRNLAIDEETVQFLTDWKIAVSDKFYGGGDVPDDSPVCTNDSGNYLSPAAFDKWRREWFVEHGLGTYEKEETWTDKRGIKRYKRTGYKGFNIHELRHTQTTLLIGSGADIKTVQNRLGHSQASLTMNIYAHAIEQNDRDAADVIGGFLSRK